MWLDNYMTNEAATTIKSIPTGKVRIGDTLWVGTGSSSTEALVTGVAETTMVGFDWVYRIVKFGEDRVMVLR